MARLRLATCQFSVESDVDRNFRVHATHVWRKRAMADIYHSGRLVKDPRSRDRRSL